MNEKNDNRTAISLGSRILDSGGFDKLYKQGMALIEEVAAYLDGDGRDESRDLPRDASFMYATESMRLTTRLMQLASWLLLHRAASEGEITAEKARDEKSKVKFGARQDQRGGPAWDALPETLKDYIAKGDRLHDRIIRFESMERGEFGESVGAQDGSVSDQLAKLKAAFGGNNGR